MTSPKSRRRWTDFLHSNPSQTSPRASFILSKNNLSSKLVNSARSAKRGDSKAFEFQGLKSFESGYNLENLPKRDFQDFYKEKGIDYVKGVIKRFNDENPLLKPVAYLEAVRFKDASKTPKIL